MQERIILFDLDGTLTDSGPGIMKASQFALHAYGVERDWQELDFFVGPPLDETFGQFMPKEDIPGAIDQFRVYYHDVGWLENEPYPGVREMLDTLQKNGFRLFVATSKLESMAVQVLGHFGLAPYFEAICGAPGDNTQAGKKVNVIRAALQKAGCTDLTQAMIVGDRKHDIIGGKLAGGIYEDHVIRTTGGQAHERNRTQNSRGFTFHPRRIFPAGRAVYLGQRHQEPGLLRQSPDSHCT